MQELSRVATLSSDSTDDAHIIHGPSWPPFSRLSLDLATSFVDLFASQLLDLASYTLYVLYDIRKQITRASGTVRIERPIKM